MKKLFLALTALFVFATANAQFEEEGHVYYDSAQTQLKEVYHYYLRYSFQVNYSNGDTAISPTPVPVRHGVAITYRKDGTIESTGQYKDGKKSGQWLFYDDKGKIVVRKEQF